MIYKYIFTYKKTQTKNILVTVNTHLYKQTQVNIYLPIKPVQIINQIYLSRFLLFSNQTKLNEVEICPE